MKKKLDFLRIRNDSLSKWAQDCEAVCLKDMQKLVSKHLQGACKNYKLNLPKDLENIIIIGMLDLQ